MDEHVKPKISTIKYEFMLIYINLVWNKKKIGSMIIRTRKKAKQGSWIKLNMFWFVEFWY